MSEVYLGNPNLKKANTPIEFTEEQVLEFLKCKEDPVYFAKNYVKIVSLDEGLVPFQPYDFQEKLINNFPNPRINAINRYLSSNQLKFIFCLVFVGFMQMFLTIF